MTSPVLDMEMQPSSMSDVAAELQRDIANKQKAPSPHGQVYTAPDHKIDAASVTDASPADDDDVRDKPWKLNRPGNPDYVPYRPHQGEHRQYLRDAILGVNDGLVSMFLLVIGIAGGGLDNTDILLAGLTGAVAGAISMALGEYMATKSQAELYVSEIALEREHFKYHRDQELEQLRNFLTSVGLKDKLLEDCVKVIGYNDEHLLTMMKVFEFGQNEDDGRSPITAMLMSGALFLTGSLPSVIPFAVTNNSNDALAGCISVCGFCMFAVGAIKSWYCRGTWWHGGLENFLIGAAGAGVSYGIGALYALR